MAFEIGKAVGRATAKNNRLVSDEADLFWHYGVVRILYGLGIVLVLFASSFGYAFVPKNHDGANGFTWNPDDVRAIALSFRIVGVMVFVAGIGERLSRAIANSK